ncbi:MAG TPA: hypothetical protein VH092_12085 [Urbifossiella sp.]|nr:hypothetical protein [Urbifossiella sp.]
MGNDIRLPDLPPSGEGGSMLVEFGLGRDESDRLWRMVLAMAVRDRALSVHYRPWRPPDGELCYLVSGVCYQLVPPPPALARQVAAAAGALVCGSRLGAATRRWLGWPLRAGGRVRLVGEYGVSEWAGVVWEIGSLPGAVGPLAGVDWYRLDPFPAAAS